MTTNDLAAANERIAQLEALAAKQEELLHRQQELLDSALKANNDTFRFYAAYNQQERQRIEREADIRANAAVNKRLKRLKTA